MALWEQKTRGGPAEEPGYLWKVRAHHPQRAQKRVLVRLGKRIRKGLKNQGVWARVVRFLQQGQTFPTPTWRMRGRKG